MGSRDPVVRERVELTQLQKRALARASAAMGNVASLITQPMLWRQPFTLRYAPPWTDSTDTLTARRQPHAA